jgi:hypothetical protein
MATITAFVSRNTKKLVSQPIAFTVANAVTIPVGAFTMLPGSSGDTANRGYLDNYINESTAIYAGLCESWAGAPILTSVVTSSGTAGIVVGNTSPGAPYAATLASVETGTFILMGVSIAGGSAQTDVGKKVWMLNNNDFTLTSQTSVGLSGVVGRVVNFVSATNENILLYGMTSSDLLVS